jgi:hypothetical protein
MLTVIQLIGEVKMKTSLDQNDFITLTTNLIQHNQEVDEFYPGDSAERQPVQTVYGGAHLFKSDTAQKLSSLSLKFIEAHAPSEGAFSTALNIPKNISKEVYSRVMNKLEFEAVEDFRIDFEDGFGNRPNEEEDAVAITASSELAKGMKNKTIPPFIGIRIKSFTNELIGRSLRTLDLFITNLANETEGHFPNNFVVTLPKITHVSQVETLVGAFERLESKLGLKSNSLKMEFMVEATQTLFDIDGKMAMPGMLKAARGRCRGAHFGTYDFTASVDVIADHQQMNHYACDFAKHLMKSTFAGTGVWLSDGATNVMPVGPHRGELTKQQQEENTKVVHDAWRLSYKHTWHSLVNGLYQGWDLHPGQLPVRYAAVYTFFLQSLEQASIRLKNFIEVAAKATLVGDVFDDAATGQGLLNFFIKAYNCGAIGEDEILKTGLRLEELRQKSFYKIVQNRQ